MEQTSNNHAINTEQMCNIIIRGRSPATLRRSLRDGVFSKRLLIGRLKPIFNGFLILFLLDSLNCDFTYVWTGWTHEPVRPGGFLNP